MAQKIIIGVIAVILIGAGAYYLAFRGSSSPLGEKPVNSAQFSCDADKTIQADFYKDKVRLVLSDGRTLDLPQAVSASGARYADAAGTTVFWNKGDTAFVTEGSDTNQTFANCEVVVPGAPARTSYASSTMGISLKYAPDFRMAPSYQYTGFPKKPISGVKLLIPDTMATGTNLSSFDTGVSVEQLPRAKNCTADIFITQNVKPMPVAINGVAYTVATTSDAAVGNRYEETVYALTDSKPCTAVRYFLHYAAIENFDPEAVKAFDRDAIMAAFDKIRDSVRLTSQGAAATSTTI